VFSNDVLNSVFRLVCLAVLKVHHLRSFSVLSGSLNCSWLGFCGMFSSNVVNIIFRAVSEDFNSMYFQRCGQSIQVFEYSGYDPVKRRRKVRYLGSFSVLSGPPAKLSDRLQAALNTPERQQKFEALLSDFLAREKATLSRHLEESILENLARLNEQLQQAIQLGCLSYKAAKAIQKEAETLHKNAKKLGARQKQLPLADLHQAGGQQV